MGTTELDDIGVLGPHCPQNGMPEVDSSAVGRNFSATATGSRNVYELSTQSPRKGDDRYVSMDE